MIVFGLASRSWDVSAVQAVSRHSHLPLRLAHPVAPYRLYVDGLIDLLDKRSRLGSFLWALIIARAPQASRPSRRFAIIVVVLEFLRVIDRSRAALGRPDLGHLGDLLDGGEKRIDACP